MALRRVPPPIAPALALTLLYGAAGAQGTRALNGYSPGQPPTPAPPVTATQDVLHLVPGKVRDLARDAAGRVLYCTGEGEVGRITPGGGLEVLADAATGPFPNEPRAVVETLAGDVAVLDSAGDIRVLVGGAPPALLHYSDLFMLDVPTDMIVDARGSFLIASKTPTSGQRGIGWVSADGQDWGYHVVKHQPFQLAADPLTGGVLVTDWNNLGQIQLVQNNSHRFTTALDTTTRPAISILEDDGDLAVETDGDIYWAVDDRLYVHRRGTGLTKLLSSGFGFLRGVVIAASSGRLPSATGWSLYLAEGDGPTVIRELPGTDAPASLVAVDQGEVPDRGLPVAVTFGFNCLSMAADNQGDLLLGGSLWGAPNLIKRVSLAGAPSISTVASTADGLTGTIEGLAVAPDDTIYALTDAGVIHAITEGPLAISTVFTDPLNQITAGLDLALDVDGSFYVGTRDAWGVGKLLRVSGGTAFVLRTTGEGLGLAARPAGGLYLSQFNDAGFLGSLGHYRFSDGSLSLLTAFPGLNYGNGWSDGALCVDAAGSVYAVAEDEWTLARFDPGTPSFARIGAGYLNHPSGLAIAPSTAGSGSTTGWSLYVAEWNSLWEKPSVPAPASTLVDASLGLNAGGAPASGAWTRSARPTGPGPLPASVFPPVTGVHGSE